MSDSPFLQSTESMTITFGGVIKPVDYFAVRIDFELYFAVRTNESSLASEKVYTQRGKSRWDFDGFGSVDNLGSYEQTGDFDANYQPICDRFGILLFRVLFRTVIECRRETCHFVGAS